MPSSLPLSWVQVQRNWKLRLTWQAATTRSGKCACSRVALESFFSLCLLPANTENTVHIPQASWHVSYCYAQVPVVFSFWAYELGSYYLLLQLWNTGASIPWSIQRGPAKRWSRSYCTCDQTSRSSTTHMQEALVSIATWPWLPFYSSHCPLSSLTLFQPLAFQIHQTWSWLLCIFSSCCKYYFTPFSTLFTS